jgi:hypothetical protein
MSLKLIRYSDNGESTLGLLFLNEEFMCYTLEDTFRKEKVAGKTRIPEGKYQLGLRKAGKLHNRYKKKFPDFHKGMLHIKKVPNFKYILIHIGNHKGNTDGCLLLGDSANNNTVQNGFISSSTGAYKRVYPEIAKAIEEKKIRYIEIKDKTFS